MRQSYKHKFEKEAEANKSKSEFLSNMSHELRTPMHAILSYASMGLENLGEEGHPSLKKYFGNIQTAGKRLLSLLNNLLDLAKIESGKMEFHFKENHFRTVVDDTVVELNALLAKKGINVDVHYESVLEKTTFDREKMVQVLVNLMSNSIKFSPESSTIHIKVEDAYLPKTKEEVLLCSVIDEGVGIPADEVDSVFEKFIQSSKTKTQAGGTGLGLSICKQIVEAHGGRIWVKNGENEGAIFQFQLPFTPKTSGGSLS